MYGDSLLFDKGSLWLLPISKLSRRSCRRLIRFRQAGRYQRAKTDDQFRLSRYRRHVYHTPRSKTILFCSMECLLMMNASTKAADVNYQTNIQYSYGLSRLLSIRQSIILRSLHHHFRASNEETTRADPLRARFRHEMTLSIQYSSSKVSTSKHKHPKHGYG